AGDLAHGLVEFGVGGVAVEGDFHAARRVGLGESGGAGGGGCEGGDQGETLHRVASCARSATVIVRSPVCGERAVMSTLEPASPATSHSKVARPPPGMLASRWTRSPARSVESAPS